MNLTLRDIEYFVTVVEQRSFMRAAVSLGVTQPALSKSIKRLEEETGLTLIARNSRPIQLTSQGLAFLEHARRLRVDYAEAMRTADGIRTGSAGLLRVGATGATLDTLVFPALARMYPQRPAMSVQITRGLSDDLEAGIEDGRIDLAVIPTYQATGAHLDSVAIGTDRWALVASLDHPLARQRKLALADLVGERWVLPAMSSHARGILEQMFTSEGLPVPAAALEVDSITEGVLDLISQTSLIAAVSEPLLERMRHLRLAILPGGPARPLRRDVSLVSRGGAIWSPLMSEFRAALLAKQAVAGTSRGNSGP